MVRGPETVLDTDDDSSSVSSDGEEEDWIEVTDDSMQPRRPSRKVQSVETLKSQSAGGAIDLDSFAEALLAEAGIGTGIEAISSRLAAATTVKKRKGFVDAEKLSKNWFCSKEAAQRTLEVTTQRAVRDFTHTSGGRRLKPYSYMLRHKRIDTEVYTDTLFGKVKSLRGNTCCQVYATPFQFIRAYPMVSKKEAHTTVDEFFRKIGVPQAIIPDNAKELTLGEFQRKCRRAQCPILPIEAYTPNANMSEMTIRELKRLYRRIMIATGAPEVLWDYCIE